MWHCVRVTVSRVTGSRGADERVCDAPWWLPSITTPANTAASKKTSTYPHGNMLLSVVTRDQNTPTTRSTSLVASIIASFRIKLATNFREDFTKTEPLEFKTSEEVLCHLIINWNTAVYELKWAICPMQLAIKGLNVIVCSHKHKPSCILSSFPQNRT